MTKTSSAPAPKKKRAPLLLKGDKGATFESRVALPAWAKPHPYKNNTVLVDPDKAYPAILEEIGDHENYSGELNGEKLPTLNPAKPSKYWAEVAYQFMKMDLQHAAGRFGFTIIVQADGDRKKRWNHTMLPGTDADVERASKGKEARLLYSMVRGFIPS